MKKKKSKLGVNEFFNISKFPSKPGICVFGISMPYIDKRQSPAKLFKSSMKLMPKIVKTGVGDVMVYSNGLYMHSQEPASTLKKKHQKLMEEHKRGYLKLIEKNIYLVTSAYSFITWDQLILDCQNFQKYFEKIKKVYSKDKLFQKYVKLDITSSNKKFDSNNINYILEEVLLDFLVAKGKVRLQNDFVQDKEKWILNCYNGKPHRTHVYVHQKNFFKIKSENVYQNAWYNFDEEKLYEFDRMNIDTFDFN